MIALLLAALAAALLSAGAPPEKALAKSKTEFQVYKIADPQAGMPYAVMAVPKGWKVASEVKWRMEDASRPVRMRSHVANAEGSVWLDIYTPETFYFLQPDNRDNVRIGGRNLGMVHAGPRLSAIEAMKYLIQIYRGREKNLKLVSIGKIPNLPKALGLKQQPGISIGAQIHFVRGGHGVDEVFFLHMMPVNRASARNPLDGRVTYESHLDLGWVHSMGGFEGKLMESMPLLSYVMGTFRENPAWQKYRARVIALLNERFQKGIDRTYAEIRKARDQAAAINARTEAQGRQIDAQLASEDAAYQAMRRDAESAAPSEASADGYSGYIRDTQRVKDPYWGTSEQSTSEGRFHWTDGFGTYQHSDDPNFDPNQTSNVTWEQMEAE